MKMEFFQKLKLAALDLDGTLLDEAGRMSPDNAAAVRRMQSAGVHVVLASGRHYIDMRPYADALPGVDWIISCQGGEAADASRKVILRREFLPRQEATLAIEIGKSLGLKSFIFGVEDVYTDSGWNSDIQFYADLAGHTPARLPVSQCLQAPLFKVIWIGEPGEIDKALESARNLVNVQIIRTHARILEMMPPAVSKATGLKAVADALNLKPSETVVFGDGDNDVPMFKWAGVSVAMAHGWVSALKTATFVTNKGPAETALSRGVDRLFGDGLLKGGRLERSCASPLAIAG